MYLYVYFICHLRIALFVYIRPGEGGRGGGGDARADIRSGRLVSRLSRARETGHEKASAERVAANNERQIDRQFHLVLYYTRGRATRRDETRRVDEKDAIRVAL